MGHVREIREERTGVWWRHQKEKCRIEDIGLLVRIILKWIARQVGYEGVGWICVAQSRNK
jgi:hypothetical protein